MTAVELPDFRPLIEAAGLPDYMYIDEIMMPLSPDIRRGLIGAKLWRVAELRTGGPAAAGKALTRPEYDDLCKRLEQWATSEWHAVGNFLQPPDLSDARVLPYEEQERGRSRIPRSLCPFCGGNPAMLRGNKVRWHKDMRKRYPYHGSPDCPGSGQLSAGLVKE